MLPDCELRQLVNGNQSVNNLPARLLYDFFHIFIFLYFIVVFIYLPCVNNVFSMTKLF